MLTSRPRQHTNRLATRLAAAAERPPLPVHSEIAAPLGFRILDAFESRQGAAGVSLRILVVQGVVTLTGDVPSAEDKRALLEICHGLEDVVRVVDEIRVRAPDPGPPAARRAATSGKASAPLVLTRAFHTALLLGLLVALGFVVRNNRGAPVDAPAASQATDAELADSLTQSPAGAHLPR